MASDEPPSAACFLNDRLFSLSQLTKGAADAAQAAFFLDVSEYLRKRCPDHTLAA